MNDPVSIVSGKSDVERAADLRAKVRPLLEQVCAVLGEANRDGMVIVFNLAPDQFGRQSIQNLTVHKPL